MNNLPKEIEDIILDYHCQLKNSDKLNECLKELVEDSTYEIGNTIYYPTCTRYISYRRFEDGTYVRYLYEKTIFFSSLEIGYVDEENGEDTREIDGTILYNSYDNTTFIEEDNILSINVVVDCDVIYEKYATRF